MRAREMKWNNYGLSDTRATELLEYCRKPENIETVRRAAIYANPTLAGVITKSLVTGKGYYWLLHTDDIDYDKADFYAYRRLTVVVLDIILQGGSHELWEARCIDGGKRLMKRGRRSALAVSYLRSISDQTDTESAALCLSSGGRRC